jgi:hypothetical protein
MTATERYTWLPPIVQAGRSKKLVIAAFEFGGNGGGRRGWPGQR